MIYGYITYGIKAHVTALGSIWTEHKGTNWAN